MSVRGLVKRYGSVTAVDGLDLELAPASVLALLGPNGAGKSTTVEVCTGFATADAGEVRVLGTDPAGAPEALRARIGVMPQGGGAYPGVRAGEMLRLVAACAANPLDPAWLIDVLGLGGCARTPYKRLSGGQQQRLALGCAIVGRPELVFLDEPTAGLDPQGRRLVWELVDALRRDGVAVLLTTHLMEEAEALADHVVIVDHGRVVAEGSPAALTTGGDQELRFRARPGMDVAGLATALPAGYRAAETLAGRYVVQGRIDPGGALGDHRLVRGTGRAGRRRAGRPAEPRGRVPGADRAGAALVTATPGSRPGRSPRDPAPARPARCSPRRPATELRLALRNGEQVLLTLVIPVLLLVGLTVLDVVPLPEPRVAAVTPSVLALAVMSTAFTSQAIALGFDRRYGVIRRLAATALPRWLLVAGRLAAVLGDRRRPGRRARRARRGARLATGRRGPGLGVAAGAARLRRLRGAGPAARGHAAGRRRAGGRERRVVRAAAGRRDRRAPGPAARAGRRDGRAAALRRAGRGAADGADHRVPDRARGPCWSSLAWTAAGTALAVRTVRLR